MTNHLYTKYTCINKTVSPLKERSMQLLLQLISNYIKKPCHSFFLVLML